VPEGPAFATEPRLAAAMIERAIAAEVAFAWAAGASVCGVGAVEMALRRAYKGSVPGVTGQHQCWSWGGRDPISGTAEDIAPALTPSEWIRLSAGAGTEGPRLYDWAYLELATLSADALDPALDESLWTRGLLIRRSLADGSSAYLTTWCPAGTPIETLVAVDGRRWAVEDAFGTAKTALGLAHNETRSGHGWHRHVSRVMLASAMRAAVRHRAGSTPQKTATRRQVLSAAGRSRRSVVSPPALPSAGSNRRS
jgi:SRSO17 transposase